MVARHGAGSRRRGHAGETRKDTSREGAPSKPNQNPPQAPVRECSHCGGRRGILNQWHWSGYDIWLHERCEVPWVDEAKEWDWVCLDKDGNRVARFMDADGNPTDNPDEGYWARKARAQRGGVS
jgi:hypothetical protein